MRVSRASVNGLVLAGINIGAIFMAFAAYQLLRPANQLLVQGTIAAVLCIFAFPFWSWLTRRILSLNLAWQGSKELGLIYLTALVWSPLIFIPLHYVTQGYLTSLGNLAAIWAFQIPVNLLALLAARWTMRQYHHSV
jgi:hypothetical protein